MENNEHPLPKMAELRKRQYPVKIQKSMKSIIKEVKPFSDLFSSNDEKENKIIMMHSQPRED